LTALFSSSSSTVATNYNLVIGATLQPITEEYSSSSLLIDYHSQTLCILIPQTSWFPRHNPNDQEAWLSRRKKRRDANKHATHHPIQHNPGC
jgi:hypothetical protein